MKKMTIFGVADKFGAIVFPYFGLSIFLHYYFYPTFVLAPENPRLFLILGIIAIAMGLAIVATCGVQLLKYWKKEELMTTMFYRVFYHPLYAGWILFIIPGIAFVLNSWLVLTSSLIAYILGRVFGREEEAWLEEKFGDTYLAYRKTVWLKFL